VGVVKAVVRWTVREEMKESEKMSRKEKSEKGVLVIVYIELNGTLN